MAEGRGELADLMVAGRLRSGLTQEELALRAGVSTRTVRNVEGGHVVRPRLHTVRLLAAAMKASHDDADRMLAAATRDRMGVRSGGIEPEMADVPAAAGPAAAIPAQLPLDVFGFTGRHAELRALDDFHGAARPRSTAVLISAVSGTAGVGKTALAVHWAYQARDQFPDGQLYVNLRGYDPERPVTAGEALTGFLVALGVAAQDIPLDVADRAARYRTQVTGRRMLILLDNASSVEQVRPLLPGTPSCAVVVTSRDSLTGLVAVHGARRLDLDLLPLSDAVALLRRLVGDRVDAEPRTAAVLAAECARLPLALRVAAELAVSRPAAPLAELAAELADQQRRLNLLAAGDDPRGAVAAVFSWSIRHLPPPAAHAFAALGLHPGPDFDGYAAAALTGTGLAEARRTLEVLARAHLVHPTRGDRYGLHDLLRAYAASLVAEWADGDRQAAACRLFDYYLAAAATAVRTMYPAGAHREPAVAPAVFPLPCLTDTNTARAWLDTELGTLAATVAHTAAGGWPGHTVRFSTILFPYLDAGHHIHALAIHGHARKAARRLGDRVSAARAMLGLGCAQYRLGSYQVAAVHFRRALTLFQRAGDRIGEADALNDLGFLEERRGRYAAAADRHERALALYRQLADGAGQSRALNSLGIVDHRRGAYASAASHHRTALTLARRTGDLASQAQALNGLGVVQLQLGRDSAGAHHLHQALRLFRQLGHRTGEAWTLNNIGRFHAVRARPDLATRHYRQALEVARDAADRVSQAWALNGLGEAAHAVGRYAQALGHHAAAITADGSGMDQQARAYTGLGHARRALGDFEAARRHYETALAHYATLDIPAASDLRTCLAGLTQKVPH